MGDILQSIPAVNLDITTQNYQFLQQHIYRESGIVLDDAKHYLLQARLMPIVMRRQLGTLNDLCALLKATSEVPLRKEVVEAMTTNETSFFRDIGVWEGLTNTVIPELMAKRGTTRSLRCWSAASSSGQEAYSLAMTLLELGLGKWNIQIVGTDLSEQMLKKARAGRYSQLEVNRGMPARNLIKYFTRHGMEWQLKEEVRSMVRFDSLDLRGSLRALGTFDLVMCRNVLIYFDVATKKKILQGIRGVLSRGGFLVLGSAETTLHLDDCFERRNTGRTTFYLTP